MPTLPPDPEMDELEDRVAAFRSPLVVPDLAGVDTTGNASIPKSTIKRAKILIVDDDEAVLGFLERVLTKYGYSRVTCTADPR